MNPNCVAGLVFFTPTSPGQTIYRPGKPGEIVEIITEGKKEFVPENPGLFQKNIPMHRTEMPTISLVSIGQKVRKDRCIHMALKILSCFYRFFIDF